MTDVRTIPCDQCAGTGEFVYHTIRGDRSYRCPNCAGSGLMEIEDSSPRIVPCETCGTEGAIITAYDNNPENEREDPCPWCDHTGGEIIETRRLDMEDLDDAHPL